MTSLLLSLAFAEVTIDDPGGCLRQEALRLELDQVLEGASDEVGVWVRATPGQVSVEVREGDEALWARTLAVASVDCPAAHLLVARSVEQGIATLPDWVFAGRSGDPADLSLAVALGVAPSPRPLSWGTRLLATGPLGGRGRWLTGLDLTVAGVGDARRGAQLLAGQLLLGPGVDLGRGERRVRAAVGMTVGAVLVAPRAPLELSGPRVVPAARAEASATLLGGGPLTAGLWLDVPVARVLVLDVGTDTQLLEPVVRGGLRLAARGRIGARR